LAGLKTSKAEELTSLNRPLTAAAALIAATCLPSFAFAQAAGAAAQPAQPAARATPATPGAAAATPATPATPAQPAAAAGGVQVKPAGDLVETLRASGQFTTFLKAADATNLTTILKTYKDLTVFAPTDAAFSALPPGRLQQMMADRPALQKIVTHHIINARVDSSKIKGAKGPVPSVAQDQILLDGSEEALKADNATIVQADVTTSNGIIHVVDQVLTPGSPAAAAASATGTAASGTSAAATQNSAAGK
jgi:uncharacterized surface protein with fasciclin (FAS1) repeats